MVLTSIPTKAIVIAARAPFTSPPASGAEVGAEVGESLSKPSAVPVRDLTVGDDGARVGEAAGVNVAENVAAADDGARVGEAVGVPV